ncbi:MAG: 4Fe-4S dicluster domain-containing protein [Candidatus Omnitrophota bacterium]
MGLSAEQLHQGKLNLAPKKGKDKRLFIDLDICAAGECKQCVIKCSYFYHQQDSKDNDSGNNGILSCAELANYALVCRRCEEAHCVNSCPVDALEQQKEKNKLLIRHNMRCISCRSCAHACPYGTIYPELVPLLIHNCDFCLDRWEEKHQPLCVSSCPYGALTLKPADTDLDDNTFLVGDNIIVHSTHWNREEA